MEIRPERPDELETIYALVKEAFETAKVSDGTEQDFMMELHQRATFIPALALVAEVDGALAGHAMYTQVDIETPKGPIAALMLAPLSVAPAHQNKGVGSALIQAGCEKAKELGWRAVFLLGDPAYYHRFGFEATTHFGIHYRHPWPEGEDHTENLMVRPLAPGALDGISGTIDLH